MVFPRLAETIRFLQKFKNNVFRKNWLLLEYEFLFLRTPEPIIHLFEDKNKNHL